MTSARVDSTLGSTPMQLRRRHALLAITVGGLVAGTLDLTQLAYYLAHVLHFLDVGEEECLRRLLVRNDRKPEGLYFASTTEAEFRAICKYFQVPSPEEGLNITIHSDHN